jgi:Cu/Ag efflux protein CusF
LAPDVQGAGKIVVGYRCRGNRKGTASEGAARPAGALVCGTNPAAASFHRGQCRESAMKTSRFVLIGAAVISASAAFAQQILTGTLTMIDRPDRNVVIQRQQNGTVGTTGANDVLKVPPNLSLDNVHVGDKVGYTVIESGGIKTVTKLEKQP